MSSRPESSVGWMRPVALAPMAFALTLVAVPACSESKTGKRSGTQQTAPEGPTVSGGDNGGAAADTSNDDGTVAPPTDVTGSYLTNLSCFVANATDSEAVDTAVTCKLTDKRGDKFPGSVSSLDVSLVLADTTDDVKGTVTMLDDSASDTFVAVFQGVSPQNSLGIEMKAVLDGKPVILQTTLLNGGATISLADKHLYVSANADATSAACSKEQPCRSINRALLFVPDIVAHRITITVGPGVYDEGIRVSGKTMRNGAILEIIGERTDPSAPFPRIRGGKVKNFGTASTVEITRNLGTEIRLRNFEIEGCYRNGVLVDSSHVNLGGIEVVKCSPPYDKPDDSRGALFVAFFFDRSSNVFADWGDLVIKGFEFPSYVLSNKCAEDLQPANPNCKSLSTFGIIVTRSSTFTLVRSNINFEVPLSVGIQVADGSKMLIHHYEATTAGGNRITIANSTRAFALYGDSTFTDHSASRSPSQDLRTTIDIGQAVYGIWADYSEFQAAFADLSIATCVSGCIYTRAGGRVAIGRDEFSSLPDGTVTSSLRLSTTNTLSANEGFLMFADANSTITVLSSTRQLRLCHAPAATKPPFEVNARGSIFLRMRPETLANVTAGCVDQSLGNVAANVGTITVSSSKSTQTACSDGDGLIDCIAAELAD